MSHVETQGRRRHAFALTNEGYSRAEVASRVGINVRTLYRWIASRRGDGRASRKLTHRAGSVVWRLGPPAHGDVGATQCR